jgi:hypothetical protein
LARNSIIFKEKAIVHEIIAATSLSILAHFPQEKNHPVIHETQLELIDSSFPWAFFDGASQNILCGGGVVLYLSDLHFYKIKMGLGQGTNNYVEVMDFLLLLKFACEQGYTPSNFLGIP